MPDFLRIANQNPNMNSIAAGKWNTCLQFISTHLPAEVYKTWFAELKFVSLKDDTLLISVPAKMVSDYITKHYRELIQRSIIEVFGPETRLFWHDAQAAKEIKQREEQHLSDLNASKATTDNSKQPQINPQLNPCYTFNNFVEGNSNKLARSVALTIAENPGQTTFSPFFLYGPSGVGKTHLVNALGVHLHELYPEKRVLFVSAHVFRLQYTDSVLHNTTNDFINFYQSIDVLIIDDFQEITTRKTQEAFFHIFNHLHQNRRQLVITCDRAPVEFEGIEDRMLTRFKWGIVAQMDKPDIALRKRILISKIQRDGLTSFPTDVIDYIAQNVESSVRELEGILNSVMAYSVMDNCEIDLDLTARVIARVVNLEKRELTIEDIMQTVSQRYGLKVKDLTSKSRKQNIVQARQLAIYLCHKYTDVSFSQIGRCFGGRDHSTVLYSNEQVSRRITVDKDYRHEVEALEALLQK